MDTTECIKSRASIRSFKPDKIPEDVVDDILDAAIHSPSSGNVQDWEFVVVTKQETKSRLAEAAWGQAFVSTAPVVIVVCSNLRTAADAYGERGTSLYSIQNTASAVQNMMLAAWDKGIGSCWVGSFNEAKVREVLILPGHVRPMAIVPVGYPAAKPQKPGRKSLDEVVHRDLY
jgi:nitroreductase